MIEVILIQVVQMVPEATTPLVPHKTVVYKTQSTSENYIGGYQDQEIPQNNTQKTNCNSCCTGPWLIPQKDSLLFHQIKPTPGNLWNRTRSFHPRI